MIKTKHFSIIFSVIVVVSCNNPYPDFSEKNQDLYMKLISFDDSEEQFQNNRYVSADIKIFDEKDLIYRQFKEDLKAPKHQMSFLYKELNVGDSATFKISKNLLETNYQEIAKNANTDFVTAYVKIHKYINGIDKKVDPEMLEQVILSKYVKECKELKVKNGVYFYEIKKGAGNEITNGKDITIHYKGRFVNQIEFDNTYNESALTFTYGTPGQVIDGIEIALKGMRGGDKSKIIIPSQLAFGEEGSSTQVVPPYTTLIYELEIVNVK